MKNKSLPEEGHPSPKVLGKYYFYQPTGLQPLRMATPEPLPQRALRQSRRLRGQKPLPPSSSPAEVVGRGAPFRGFALYNLHKFLQLTVTMRISHLRVQAISDRYYNSSIHPVTAGEQLSQSHTYVTLIANTIQSIAR